MSLKTRKTIIFVFSVLIMAAILVFIGLIAAFDVLYKIMTIFFVGLVICGGVGVIYSLLKDLVFDDWLNQAYYDEVKKEVADALDRLEKEESNGGSED